MAIAEIHVTLKPTLLDAQGATVLKALHQLGHTQVRNARIGKYITLEIDDALAGPTLAQQLDLMCQQLLANPVIEDYEIVINTTPGARPVSTARSTVPTVAARVPAAGPVAASTSGLATEEVTTLGGLPISEPFALDYSSYEVMTTEERLELREKAFQKHGPWIMKQIQERRAAWILCVGHEIVDSGPTLDTYPGDERLDQLGTANNLVPWVFTRPPTQ
jgi:phosphoribosylformylglycinamidine synthase